MAYANPLAHADLIPERIDQGVDYAIRGGWLNTLADCVVTMVSNTVWQPYGAYMEMRITEPGPLYGLSVYYAEGIKDPQPEGTHLKGGWGACSLVPGWRYGLEIGWAAGDGTARSWARAFGGGYAEGKSTEAGISFSQVIERLGGPGGIIQAERMGTAPPEVTAFLSERVSAGETTPGQIPAPAAAGPYGYIVDQINDAGLVENAWHYWHAAGHAAAAASRATLDLVTHTHYATNRRTR